MTKTKPRSNHFGYDHKLDPEGVNDYGQVKKELDTVEASHLEYVNSGAIYDYYSENEADRRIKILEERQITRNRLTDSRLKLFVRKQFNIEKIGMTFIKKYNIVTIIEENQLSDKKPHMYIYDHGVYEKNGREKIRELLKDLFEKNRAQVWKRQYETEVVAYIEGRSSKNRSELPKRPSSLVNFRNKCYDFKTGQEYEHSPDYYFFYQIPWDYKIHSTDFKIVDAIKEIVPSEYHSFIQELFGYLFYSGYPRPGIFYLFGKGGEGKSTITTLMEKMIGDKNTTAESIQRLAENRFAVANLYKKLLASCGEMSGEDINRSEFLKKITSGLRIPMEFKGLQGFSAVLYAKIITETNEIPYSHDKTSGWDDRQYILPFFKRIRDSKREKTEYALKLANNRKAMETLIEWSLQGLCRLAKNDFRFSYPRDHIEMYYACRDQRKQFVDECLMVAEFGKCLTFKEIWDVYLLRCDGLKIPILTKDALARYLTTRGYRIDATIAEATRRGIMFREESKIVQKYRKLSKSAS